LWDYGPLDRILRSRQSGRVSVDQFVRISNSIALPSIARGDYRTMSFLRRGSRKGFRGSPEPNAHRIASSFPVAGIRDPKCPRRWNPAEQGHGCVTIWDYARFARTSLMLPMWTLDGRRYLQSPKHRPALRTSDQDPGRNKNRRSIYCILPGAPDSGRRSGPFAVRNPRAVGRMVLLPAGEIRGGRRWRHLSA